MFVSRYAWAYMCAYMYINSHTAHTYVVINECMHTCMYMYMLYGCIHLCMYIGTHTGVCMSMHI